MLEIILLASGILLVGAVLSSVLSSRAGIPALILFLLVGIVAGPEGVGKIDFVTPQFANQLGIIALVMILFSGGLDTEWSTIRKIIFPGLSLATIGVFLTCGLCGVFAHYVLEFSWVMSFLIGAIISSTDAAAVFGILRGRRLALQERLGSLLEFESGSNDPMAVLLTIGIVALAMDPTSSLTTIAPHLVMELIIGAVVGALLGKGAHTVINKLDLAVDGLYTAFSVGIALLSYSVITLLHGNGFLGAYVTGLILGSKNFVRRVSLIQFHDGLSWVLQIAIFLCLGLLVKPSELPDIAFEGTALALFLILVARPIAVGIALLPFGTFSWREVLFIAWGGLRGAVPIVLATIPLLAGLPGADSLFSTIFFVVLLSVCIQGTTLERLARWLKLLSSRPNLVNEKNISAKMLEVVIPLHSPLVGKQLVAAELPRSALVVLVFRGSESFVPRGDTVFAVHDKLLLNVEPDKVHETKDYFEGQHG